MTLKVSIIIPTHNRPDKLRRALESIARQTYQNLEAVVVNDGGQDIGYIVKNYAFARLVNHRRNQGLPAARNTGIKNSAGVFIAYLDDDDWYYPQHIEDCIECATGVPAGFVYTNADALKADGEIDLYFDKDYSPEWMHKHNITPVCCVLHWRGLLDKTGLFDESLRNHEDYDLWLRMAQYVRPYHVKETTCCIDRSEFTMSRHRRKMEDGLEIVRRRHENTALLSA